MKKVIRLTESDLHKIVRNSVKKILREGFGDGHVERALQELVDNFMDENNENESDALDCFYYLWERAGYGNVEVNYDTSDLNYSGIIFQNEQGEDVIIVGPKTIYFSPEFEYAYSTNELNKWNNWAIILQREVINCIENV